MSPRRLLPLLLIVTIGMCSAAESRAEPDAGCILYGDKWAVALSAPEGWVLECRGPDGDVEVALWPKGETWADATAVMYVNSSAPEGETLEQFAAERVKAFKEEQPSIVVKDGSPLLTADKRNALVRRFTGDQWENHEAVSYVDGGSTFLLVVLSSRSEERFKSSYPAFESFVSKVLFMKKTGGS